MAADNHMLRDSEIEKLLHIMDKVMPQPGSAAMNPEDKADLFWDIAQKMTHTLKSNGDDGVSPEVLKQLKLVLDTALSNSNPMQRSQNIEKAIEFIKELTPHSEKFINKVMDAVQDKKLNLDVASKLVMEMKNHPEQIQNIELILTKAIDANKNGKSINLNRFCELLMKGLDDPKSLTKDEQKQLTEDMMSLDIGLDFLKNLMNDKKDTNEVSGENMMQVAVYEGGYIVDIVEGVFVPGSKASVSLEGLLAKEGDDLEIDNIEAGAIPKGVIEELHKKIGSESAVSSSAADKHNMTPNFTPNNGNG
jgi:hypothetical protein